MAGKVAGEEREAAEQLASMREGLERRQRCLQEEEAAGAWDGQ